MAGNAINIGSVYATFEIRDDAVGRAVSRAQSSFDRLGSSMSAAGSTLTRNFTLPVVAGFGLAAKGAIDFGDNLANVRKTTGATKDELVAIGNELLSMSKHTRTSANELVAIATIGGQIGIAAKDIVGFTRAVDKMNVALGDEFTGGAEEVTQAVGGLRQIFRDIRTDNVENDLLHIGNALNTLGAQGLATGPVMSDFAGRIGGVTQILGQSSGEILGMSATLQELNVTAERGSTAVTRTFQIMAKETDKFAKIVGVSGAEFKKMVDDDINGAFLAVLDGIKRLNPSATEMAELLDELGLNGAGASEVFGKLSQNTDLLRQKQAVASKALQGTSSILDEYNVKNETAAAKVEKLRNRLVALFITQDGKVSEATQKLIDLGDRLITMLEKAVKWFENLDGSTQDAILNVLAFAVALGPILKILGGVLATGAKLKKGFDWIFVGRKGADEAAGAMSRFGKAIDGIKKFILQAGVTMLAWSGRIGMLVKDLGGISGVISTVAKTVVSKMGLIGLAISTAVVGGIAIWKNWDKVVDIVTGIFDTVVEKIKEFPQKVSDVIVAGYDAFLGGLATVKTKVEEIFAGVNEALQPWRQDFVGTFTKTWMDIQAGLDQYNDEMYAKFSKGWDETVRGVQDWWSNLQVQFATGVSQTITGIATFWDSIGDKFAEGIENTVTTVSTWWTNLGVQFWAGVNGFLSGVETFFTDLGTKFGEGWNSVTKTMENWWKGFSEGFSLRLEDIGKAIGDTFRNLPNLLGGTLNKSGQDSAGKKVDGITQKTTSQDTIRKVGDAIVKMIGAVVVAVGFYLVDAGIRLVQWILNGVNRKLGEFADKGRQMVGNIASGIAGAWSTAWNAITGVVRSVVNRIGDFINNAYQAGKNIVTGMANGIRDAAGEAWNAITNVANEAVAKAKAALKIQSPSRVFQDIGRYTMLGMQKGIVKNGSGVIDAARDLALATSGAYNNNLGINDLYASTRMRSAGQRKVSSVNAGSGASNYRSQVFGDLVINDAESKEDVMRRMGLENYYADMGMVGA